MFMSIDTWLVTIESERTTWDKPIRVPQTDLAALVKVLTFNQYEFKVERERENVEPDV